MKNLFFVLLIALIVQGCLPTPPIPLPDLDPNTGEGGEMLIFEIADVIAVNTEGTTEPQFEGFHKEYDINDNGTTDLEVKNVVFAGVSLRFNGQIALDIGPWSLFGDLFDFYDTYTPIFLPANGLLGETLTTAEWEERPMHSMQMFIEAGTGTGPYIIRQFVPVGISYIPIRIPAGQDFYYGWIELIVSDFEDTDFDDVFIVSRVGLSTTPGVRVRMGQG